MNSTLTICRFGRVVYPRKGLDSLKFELMQNSSGVNHPSLLENFRGLKFLSGLIFVRDAKAYRTSDKLKLIGHDSAEVLDQHDVTVEWILFGVEDLMTVW
jgi:hypothetical protein